MVSNAGRSIAKSDNTRIARALRQHEARDFEGLRTAALVFTAWGAGLRIGETVALDVFQVAELQGRALALSHVGYIRNDQAKGGPNWSSAGQFVITPRARRALRAYIAEARRRKWLELAEGAPLFLSRNDNRGGHSRLSERGARKAWARVQARAGIARPYRFHDLRHDALTSFAAVCNGNPFQVQAFGRLQDVRTASHYIHGGIDVIAELAAQAERR